MSNLVNFAESEMKRAGLFDKDADYGGMLADGVMRLVKTFAEEGHSGGSAHMTMAIFEKVARFHPLTPLTGADDEWMDVSEMSGTPMWQNCRCSSVFTDKVTAWDIDRPGDRVPITFPYDPTINADDRAIHDSP
jgi:hypothetical protein